MIRRASASDAPAIAALEAAAAWHPWSADQIAATLALATTRAWVAGAPYAGYLISSVAAGEAEILTVGVDPVARRGGVGRALVAACLANWAEEGVTSGFLEVRADNAGARALYRATGWEEIGVRRGYYADGADALLMRHTPESR